MGKIPTQRATKSTNHWKNYEINTEEILFLIGASKENPKVIKMPDGTALLRNQYAQIVHRVKIYRNITKRYPEKCWLYPKLECK